MKIAVDVLLGLAILAAWVGGFGLLRLRTPLERLHCIAFVNAGAGSLLGIAVWLQDGVTSRSVKTLLVLVILLFAGAAVAHATGRALLLREGSSR
ncbi:MAG TPA: monovalent cation/H(+) antiporter subunit G [Stellaceae bacterium]|nr:monovalent cation/H(+) antiporter subunit G [Stellaceae bacterium]